MYAGYVCPINSKYISRYSFYFKGGYYNTGFKEIIRMSVKIQGVVQYEYIPKYRLITSHTARRTFITINVLKGINLLQIRKSTRHKSQAAFERYICYSL